MGSNIPQMKKAPDSKPATPPTTNPPATGIEEPVTPEMLADIDRHLVAIAARISALEERVQALEETASETDELTPTGYQAVVINENLNMFPVRVKDIDGNGFTSYEEALTAAQNYISEHKLGSGYKATVVPVW